MRITCDREALLTACQLTSAATPTRDVTKAILRHIKAVTANGALQLTATDLTLGIRHVLAGPQIEEGGEAIFPVGRLIPILRESGDETVSIEADDSRCVVRTSTGEFEMPTEDPADFPDLPDFEDTEALHMEAGVLRGMIQRTQFAVHKGEQARYAAMAGVLWELDGEQLKMVATDSKRLALAVGPVVAVVPEAIKGHSHVVPLRAVQLLERSMVDDGESVRVVLRANEALFRTETGTVYTRLLEGRYPPYRDILPKKYNVRVELPVDLFYSAVRQAAVMSDEESKRVRFSFAANMLTLTAESSKSGRSRVQMPVQYEGEPLEVFFDPAMVTDLLKASDGGSLSLELLDALKPAVFRDGERFTYLVMPMS